MENIQTVKLKQIPPKEYEIKNRISSYFFHIVSIQLYQWKIQVFYIGCNNFKNPKGILYGFEEIKTSFRNILVIDLLYPGILQHNNDQRE